jgi:YVTN family beta-propeller protein
MPGPDAWSPPAVVSIPAGSNPQVETYDSGNGLLYVLNQGSDNVTVVNGTVVVGTVNVGTEPCFATYDSKNGYVYVSNFGSANVSVINGTTLLASVNVGGEPYGSSYDSKNGYVYVPDEATSKVSVLNGTSLLTSVTIEAAGPTFSIFDRANGYVYVVIYDDGAVSVIDGTTSIGWVAVGGWPAGATYDGRNGYVYVTNTWTDNVSVIDGTTLLAWVDVGNTTYAPTYDSGNGFVYVMDYSGATVGVINGTHLLASVAVGTYPQAAAYDPENGYVVVANYGSDNVSVISGTTVVGSVNVGNAPVFAAYDDGNGCVYVANWGSDNVSATCRGYAVAFTESGLPPKTAWWVNVTGGSSAFSHASTLSFELPNGTYPYSVTSADKTYASPVGSFVLNGRGANLTATFLRVTYAVTFHETGLANGTGWSVTMGGIPHTSTTTTVGFLEPNGTHSYTIGAVPGWNASGYAGSVRVNGSAVSDSIAWSREIYLVTIEETGLPNGTWWWLNITGGASAISDTATLEFREPNGTYPCSVSTVDKTYASSVRSFTVNGPTNFQVVAFDRVNYEVTFVEAGLSQATSWSVGLYATEQTSTTTTVSFAEPNGTYPFLVSSVSGYARSPSSGNVVVSGANVTKTIAFTAIALPTYAVTFAETGLPSGTGWSVTLNGSTSVGAGDIVFLGFASGTYAFSVGSVAGYTATPGIGTITVSGANVSQAIAFRSSSSSPATFLGLPATEGYGTLGGVVIALVVALGVLALVRRRRKAPPEPAAGPTRPSAGDPPDSP